MIEAFNFDYNSATIWVMNLLQSLLLLVVGWWIINKACKLSIVFFQKSISDVSIASFLDSVIKFSLRIILIVAVLGQAGFNVTSLFAAIGASLIAVGISLKDNISNLVSGIILVVTKPIHVGDYIEFENAVGTVIKIEMLFTTVQAEKGKTVIIPNSRLVSNNIARKSNYDISELNFSYEFEPPLCGVGAIEINKYFEKEFVLNSIILQFPAPNVKVEKMNEENKIVICLKVWIQNQNLKRMKEDVDKMVQKFSQRYKIILKPCDGEYNGNNSI